MSLDRIKDAARQADQRHSTGGLLATKVDAAAKGLLRNKVNPNRRRQKLLVVDRSGSMAGSSWSMVPDAIYRDLACSLIFDDDGKVPTLFFDDRMEDLVVDLNNFYGIVEANRIKPRGSTDLTGALHWVAKQTGNGDLFERGGLGFSRRLPAPTSRTMKTGAYVTLISDGQPNDGRTAIEAVQRLSYRGVFLKLLYVGNNEAGWNFFRSLDDDIPVGAPYERGGRLIDNVDAKRFVDVRGVSDEAFFDAMFDEVPEWDAAALEHGLIAA